MRLLLLLFLSITHSLVQAQDTSLDSAEVESRVRTIQQSIRNGKGKLADSTIARYYLEIAEYESLNFDYLAAANACDEILKECPKLDFVEKKGVEEQKALYLREAGQTDEAIKIFLRILGEFEDRRNFKESADLNKRIGIIFLKMDDLKNAEYYLLESIEQARKSGEHEIEGYSLMSLGNRYKAEARFEQAEKHYLQSIEIAKKYNIKRLLAGNYNNYGSLFRMMKQNDRAMEYYKLAVQINKEIGNDVWLSYNYNNLGNMYDNKKNYSEALKYFFLSMEIKEKEGDLRGKTQTLSNIAGVYEALGNFQEAYKYQTEFTKLSDSLLSLDKLDATRRIAAEFQAEKREAKILQLNMQDKINQQELQAQDERISHQNFVASLMGIGILLVLVIAGILWRTAISRKRINDELRDKNSKIDFQHNEIIASINYAKRIQNSILPGEVRLKELLTSYDILFRPKDIISGDFYFCDSYQSNIYFGVVDCTGHGVPGAMVSIVASSHINRALHEYALTSPEQILTKLNEEVPAALSVQDASINDGMDMSICAVDLEKMKLRFAGAKHNCWIINTEDSIAQRQLEGVKSEVYKENGFGLIELKGDRQGIGKSYDFKLFELQEVNLIKGDKILLSSDGFADQFGGPKSKKFKISEMRKLTMQNADATPKELINTLNTELQVWMGAQEQIDDICVLVVRI